MTPQLLLALTIRPTLAWLSSACGIPAGLLAERMLLAIALQETALAARRQGGNGPAMGFWQFERLGGVAGVLSHLATKKAAAAVCEALVVPADKDAVWAALQHNDTLACAFARLLLWTDPKALPSTADEGWACYLRLWRPGKPHPEKWPAYWAMADRAVAAAA